MHLEICMDQSHLFFFYFIIDYLDYTGQTNLLLVIECICTLKHRESRMKRGFEAC